MRPLSNVQVLRGIAALLVVVFHIREEIGERLGDDRWPSMTFGAFGVDIFFVISGFILVYATAPEFGSVRAAPTFFLRRLTRIVPLYWAVTAAYALFMVRTHQDPGYTAPYLAASLSFLPYPQPGGGDYSPAYSLGWTLEYEMFFYLCLAGVIALPRTLAVSTLSVVLLCLAVAGQLVPMPWPLDFWSNSQIIEFVFGMILAEAYLRKVRLPGWLCVALALGGFAAVLASVPSMDQWWAYRGLGWGLPGAALVGAAVFHRPRKSGAVRRFLERLGDASYSIYLIHYLVFVLVAHLLRHHLTAIPPLGYAALLLAASVGAAMITYRYFERPVTRSLQRLLVSRPPHRVARSRAS